MLGACLGTSAFIERRGASKDPENEQPERQEGEEEVMVSYKEEEQVI